MRLLKGHLNIEHSRWPWQTHPFQMFGGRFGGGWNLKFGVDISWAEWAWHVNFNLLLGVISVYWRTTKRLEAASKINKQDTPTVVVNRIPPKSIAEI